MARGTQAAARERARAARLKADADRAEQDKKIEQVTTEFYAGQVRLEELETEVKDCRTSMSGAVVALGDLREPIERIAVLCGVSPAEVRALRKEHKKLHPQPAGATHSAGTDDSPPVRAS